MKRVKKFGVNLVLNRMKIGKKRVVSVHTAVFERARKWGVKRNSVSERNFLFTCGILSSFFLNFFVWDFFGYGLLSILGWVWWWFEGFWKFIMNFMLIRTFFMYFADFWANFYDFFFTIVLFFCLRWVLKIPLLLEQFLFNTWLQYCGFERFFEKYDKKMSKIATNFLIFFAVFGFFCSLDKFLGLL